MRNSLISLVLAAVLLPVAAAAQTVESDAPQYIAGSQYTAELNQTNGRWRLLPAAGQDVVIDTGTCATGSVYPKGLWLLVRDANGNPELLAPSSTPLPAGSPDHIAIQSCDKATGDSLAVPQQLIDLLAADTGAVLLDD